MNLASGLKSLDGIGSNQLNDDLWDDATLILEQGLYNVVSGQNLEKGFHAFIDNSLRILAKNAFVLVFDDIDTSVNQGKNILELLRKYITTPQIITILSGDLDLYATIVRQLQWQNLDGNKILKEYEFSIPTQMQKYRAQVDHLEDQYLNKVLRPENRIRLKSLNSFDDEDLAISFAENNEITLKSFIHSSLSSPLLIPNGHYYLDTYHQLLQRQPLRSQIEIYKYMATATNASNNEDHQLRYSDILHNVFYTALSQHVDTHFNALVDGKDFLNRLSIYLLQKELSDERNLKLLSDSKEDYENISNMYIQVLANETLKIEDYFTYFLRIGLLHSLCFERGNGHLKDRQAVIRHVSLDETEIDMVFAQKAISLANVKSLSAPGVFKVEPYHYAHVKEIPEHCLFLTGIKISEKSSIYGLSIYKFLGVLADLLRFDDDFTGTFSHAQEISMLYSIDAAGIDNQKGIENSKGLINEQFSSELPDEITEQMQIWLKKKHTVDQKLSPTDLAKVWLHYLDDIEYFKRQFEEGIPFSETLDFSKGALLNALHRVCSVKKAMQINTITLFEYLELCPLFRKGTSFNTWEEKKPGIAALSKDVKQVNKNEQRRILSRILPNLNSVKKSLKRTSIKKELKDDYGLTGFDEELLEILIRSVQARQNVASDS